MIRKTRPTTGNHLPLLLSQQQANSLLAADNLRVASPLQLIQDGSGSLLRFIDGTIKARIKAKAAGSSAPANAYPWEEVQPNGSGGWETTPTGRSGTEYTNPAYSVNSDVVPTNSIVYLLPGQNLEYYFWLGGGESFLAQIIKKTYITSTFVTYSWVRVTDGLTPYPITYVEYPLSGGPGDNPAYHEENIDLPVWPPTQVGPNSPSSGTNDNAAGDVGWSNPGNITSSDNAYATASLNGGQTTQYLKGTNYGFSIPSGAIITGIKVEVEQKATATTVADTEAKLVVGGSIVGTNKAANAGVPSTDTYYTYDYSPTQWGVALTYSDVNASNFGFVIRYHNSSGTETVSVDHIRITISYSLSVQKHSVVRLRKGSGSYYLMDQLPWEDLFIRSDSSDGDGVIGHLRYYDQNDATWKSGEEVRIVIVE